MKIKGKNMVQAPAILDHSKKFSSNVMSAHALVLKAKKGEKGTTSGDRYAVPAFNMTTFQGINAAFKAFNLLGSSGLLAFSNSAVKHLGQGDPLFGIELAATYVKALAARSSVRVATHLDHGDFMSYDGKKVVRHAVKHFTSVMADNSTDRKTKEAVPLQMNIDLTREVVDMAHPRGVSVEGELGVLAGVEDEEVQSEESTYTDPNELEQFLKETGVLMLAPTIGTKHGANKGKPGEKVKLNIALAHELLNIADTVNPEIVFVAHGASTLYQNVVDFAVKQLRHYNDAEKDITIWQQFVGTDWDQIKQLLPEGFCKINTDTENRQTYLAALLGAVNQERAKVDIRFYDTVTTEALTQSYIQKLIMCGNYGVWHEPKIDVSSFKFEL